VTDPVNVPLKRRSLAVGSPNFAELVNAYQVTSQAQIDHLLNTLLAHKDDWAQLAVMERLSVLDEIRRDLRSVKDRWIHAELEAKGIAIQTMFEAEEWVILATVFRAVRKLRHSLVKIQKHGRPRIPGPITSMPNGQIAACVFPQTLLDRIIFLGINGEVWMEPGVTADEIMATQASEYRDKNLRGKVALVLGAGNSSLVPVIDILHKLFVELQVVVLKMNPVNAHMGPLVEEGFRALVNRGFLGIVYGGAEEGSYLCNHPAVEELHMTGSDKTYEAIVFGGGSEGKRRKAEHKPLNRKRFTGELGNVSPVIIVPGPWKRGDIEQQAKHIATWLAANAGFSCLTPRVIVQHRSWTQRNDLMDEIGRVLDHVPTRRAYYPGAHDRYAEFLAAHPESLRFGTPSTDHLPWTIIPDVDPENADDICFKHEAFCSLCAETAIEAPSIARFIDRAVEFVNHALWGTLNATLIVHPKSLKDPDIAAAVDRAIAGLRYGTVSLNILAYYSAYFMVAPWGAFPGHDIYDIQSGTGKTFNFLMLKRSEKSVVRAPFRRLDPLTVKSKRALEFSRKLAEFETSGSWWGMPGLIWNVLRSES
jgi:hypothetical protein